MGSRSQGSTGSRPSDFEELWQAEFPQVFRSAYLLIGDREAAADLAQEAFARAFARWGHVGGLDRPDAWVRRVVHNLAVSWLRRRAIAAKLSIRAREASTLSIDSSGEDRDLMRALARLTPAQRVVLVLRFYEDRSIEQVAQATGKRPGTVRALTSQGLARMRDLLTEEVQDE